MRFRFLWVSPFFFASAALAQWNPSAGQWLKSDATDLRVMTWNIEDGICSTATQIQGFTGWTGLAGIVAAMQPDILIMQEVGDNDGNGTGSGVDSVATLTTTINTWLHGDGNGADAWVQKYAPGFDFPYLFVSTNTDGFNRNVILSRLPFLDLNGDTKSQLSNIPTILGAGYAPGGTGGIRGFQFAEINLPDATYLGNIVIGNAHLKSGGTTADHDERILAAKNVAYYIDYLFNGAGTGTPDPNSRILDSPAATSILNATTPVVIGGDWNEDELNNGQKGPAEWLTFAEFAAGTDGTDRDRSDMLYDDARNFFTNNRTTQGSSKLDYVAWQESIVTLRRAFIFNSSGLTATQQPAEVEAAFPSATTSASSFASDHRPIIIDFILPLVPSFPDCNGNLIDDALEPDGDGDGVIDDCDGCPLDMNKTAPGICGCGQADSSGDGDTVADCVDNCNSLANQLQDNVNGDGDGDVCDVCPADPIDGCITQGSEAAEAFVGNTASIITPDGAFELTVNPGQMPANETLSVTQWQIAGSSVDIVHSALPGLGTLLADYRLAPAGFAFVSPASMSIDRDVSTLNAFQRGNVGVYVYDAIDDEYEQTAFSCPVVQGPPGTYIASCSGAISAMNRYAIIAPFDGDDDGVPDDFGGVADNCPTTPNANQHDGNGNGVGNACDPAPIPTMSEIGMAVFAALLLAAGSVLVRRRADKVGTLAGNAPGE